LIRNQQVASSILAGGSSSFGFNRLEIQAEARRAADNGFRRVDSPIRNLPPGTTLPEKLLSKDHSILRTGVGFIRVRASPGEKN
jgi:hypothetical protein